MDVPRVAVIGAGQLGSRHLQGLARLPMACEIHVVDPSDDSRRVARDRFAEVGAVGDRHAVSYLESIDALPRELDLAIIATTSRVRLAAMTALLERGAVRNLLLEKVLFQRLDEYEQAERLLSAHGVRAWVNCPRRAWPIYQELQRFFESDAIRSCDVHGGDWGLGCNSVHFLDLLGFLTGEHPLHVNTTRIDHTLINSKRNGFLEFTGRLMVKFTNDVALDLVSDAGSAMRLLVTLRGERRSAIIDEIAGVAFLLDQDAPTSWRMESFRAPFLSELVTSVVSGVLETDRSSLTSYAESVLYHTPLVAALGAVAFRCGAAPDGLCPIT